MSATAIEGRVDGVSGFDIVGWAWRPDAPDPPLAVTVKAAGRTLATVRADHFRADLESAGKRKGRCAFRIAIGTLGLKGAGATVRAHADGAALGEPVTLDAALVASAETYVARLGKDDDPTFDPACLCNRPTIFPVKLGGPAGIEGWLERFDETGVTGWAANPHDPGNPVVLSVVHRDKEIGRIDASTWRLDLAEMRQGDGRAGIDAAPPPRLLDGNRREIDLRLVSSGLSVLDAPICVRAAPTDRWKPAAAVQAKPQRRLVPRPVQLSVIVNFYNMRREAERTLASLSRGYQLDIDDLEYEVICIDNGSKPPLDAVWIESFGPEFRLFKPSRLLPSPCFALNEAARSAKGKVLALMIDGAHVVTPGVMREAMAAFAEEPRSVVGLRQWFIGGDQRWLSASGYSRETEDIAFARISWPRNGYRLFEVSAPMMPSPNVWFDSAAETNFLMLPAEVFREVNGYDEGFDIPGGGLSNLDLFSRAVEAVGGTAVILIGEASFHQYHGGTTTNVDETSKNAEVRRYLNFFYSMRGERLKHVDASKLRFRGRVPMSAAYAVRQRPLFPASLGVTPGIRPTEPHLYFDEGAELYLQAHAVEARIPELTRWLGQPTGIAAGDLINIQEILHALRPTRIIAANAAEGLSGFLAQILGMLDIEGSRLVCVGGPAPKDAAGIDIVTLPGPIVSDAALRGVRSAIGADENVAVIFHPDEGDNLPIESLRAYMKFVSLRSYLVFTGAATGQPWLGYSTRWYRKAIQILTGPESEFQVDPSWEFHLVTACPWGYLRRIGSRLDRPVYDAALDDLETL